MTEPIVATSAPLDGLEVSRGRKCVEMSRSNGSWKTARLGSFVLALLVAGCGNGTQASVTTAPRTSPADRVVQPTPAPAPAAGTLAYLLAGDIYMAEQDGSNAVKIVDGSDCEGSDAGAVFDSPTWSPDGRYLAARFWDCSNLDSDGSGALFDAEGALVARFPIHGWGIAWSPDSTRVAVWDVRFQTVGVYGLDGARHTQLSVPPEWSASGDHDPKWTPDGTSVRVGAWALPLDGSVPRRLPWFWSDDGCATLSPDGSLVAYRGRGSVTVARSDGSDAREVFNDLSAGSDRCHVWSPTGDRIVFATHEGELRVVDVATGSVSLLIEGAPDLQPIGFSPGGGHVLFSRGGARAGLWRVRLDTSNVRLVVAGPHAGTIVEVVR